MSHSPIELSYVRLYADEAGVSHFRDEKLLLDTESGASGEAALPTLTLGNVRNARFVALRRDAVEDWHCAPRRQFLIALRGLVEVTASDGEVRRFGPGAVILVEDTTGKGHITRSVGAEDHIIIAVPVPSA